MPLITTAACTLNSIGEKVRPVEFASEGVDDRRRNVEDDWEHIVLFEPETGWDATKLLNKPLIFSSEGDSVQFEITILVISDHSLEYRLHVIGTPSSIVTYDSDLHTFHLQKGNPAPPAPPYVDDVMFEAFTTGNPDIKGAIIFFFTVDDKAYVYMHSKRVGTKGRYDRVGVAELVMENETMKAIGFKKFGGTITHQEKGVPDPTLPEVREEALHNDGYYQSGDELRLVVGDKTFPIKNEGDIDDFNTRTQRWEASPERHSGARVSPTRDTEYARLVRATQNPDIARLAPGSPFA
jgi:hypothetical protein